MRRFVIIALAVGLLATTAVGCGKRTQGPEAGAGDQPIELSFYYPVAVGGPLTKIIDSMVAEFTAANPNIKVEPVFSGSYADTLTKVQTLIQGGQTPDVAVLLSTDVYTLVDQDAIVPLNPFIDADPDGQSYISDFFPAFMANSKIGDTVYGIPFQRSTVVMYYNKDMFAAAGLGGPPKTWEELVSYGKVLTKKDQGIWGLEIPSDGYPYWLLSGFAIQAGKNLMNADGTEVYFNSPENIQAVKFFRSLATESKIMPDGVTAWTAVPTDFIGGKAAMIYHSSGSLTNILKNATFEVGVAFQPAGPKGYGTPTGGGNLYIFKGITPAEQQAAWKFIRFMTEPERMAAWSQQTGYVAARQSSWETPSMKQFTAEKPQYLVSRDQLQYAQPELSVHNNPQVYKVYNDRLQAIITGAMSVEEALAAAQQEAEALLAPFKGK